MTNNLNTFSGQDPRYVFWGLWDSVSANYLAGTSGTLASGEDSGMGRALGITNFGATTPEATQLDNPGDGGLLGTAIGNPTTGPSGSAVYGAFDQVFDTKATGRKIKAVGPHDISYVSSSCNVYRPLFLIVNSPAQSREEATYGEQGWIVEEFLYVTAQPLGAERAIGQYQQYTHRLIFNSRGVTQYGATITDLDFGLTRTWKSDPYWSPYPVYGHTYVGDGGAAQTFTLGKIPVADDGDALQIWDNGAALAHTTNYSVSATTGLVTFVGTDPAAGHFSVCKVMFNPDC